MTLNMLVAQGTRRNSKISPEHCVFTKDDGVALEIWAKNNNVLWRDSADVSAATLANVLADSPHCLLWIEEGDGCWNLTHQVCHHKKSVALKEAAEELRSPVGSCLILDRTIFLRSQPQSLEF